MRVERLPNQHTIAEICKQLHLSPLTVMAIIKRFQEELAFNVFLAGFGVDDFSKGAAK